MTDPHPRLDHILSSMGRIRILTLLSQVSELHITEIAKRTDQSYSATERHLEALERADLVEERDYGRIRLFRLQFENPRAKLLRNLILDWDEGRPRPIDKAQA